jgi:hypothetical protein
LTLPWSAIPDGMYQPPSKSAADRVEPFKTQILPSVSIIFRAGGDSSTHKGGPQPTSEISWRLLRDSLDMTMDAVPPGIDIPRSLGGSSKCGGSILVSRPVPPRGLCYALGRAF